MRGAIWRTVALAAALGLVAAIVAGYTLDGAGRFALGPWAASWGAVGAAVGASLGLTSQRRSRAAGLRAGALVLLAVALGTWAWIVAWGVPLATIEGAWMYSLAAGATLGAAFLARSGRGDHHS